MILLQPYVTREQLDAAGASFDYAIPQALWDAIHDATGRNPHGHVVTLYQSGDVAGRLLATSQEGALILRDYQEATT